MTASRTVHVNIVFRNTESTQPIKEYVQEKVSHCLQKFVHRDTEAQVVLSVEKTRHIAQIHFAADGKDFNCSEESGDLYASIDRLVDSLSGQLRKHKEKLTNHHAS